MLKFTKKDTSDFAELLFVANAIGKEKRISILMHILKTEDGDLVAKNGQRCHIYRACEALSPGLYEVTKKTKTELILSLVDTDNLSDFPDYKRVIPEKSETMDLTGDADSKTATVLRSMIGGCLDLKYLSQALSVNMTTVCKSDGSNPVRLDGENVTTVIMPKRI